MDLLRQPEGLRDQFTLFCDIVHDFGNLYVSMFNYAKIGPYFHYLISGHVSHMLRYCNYNIANFQQQGAEAFNRDCATHFDRQSSQGGGNHAVNPALDTLLCFGRRWYRAIDEYYPHTIEVERNKVTRSDRLNYTMSNI